MYVHPIDDILDHQWHVFSVYENSVVDFIVSYHLFRFTVDFSIKVLGGLVADDVVFTCHEQKSWVLDSFKDSSFTKEIESFFLNDDVLSRDFVPGKEFVLGPLQFMFHFFFLKCKKLIRSCSEKCWQHWRQLIKPFVIIMSKEWNSVASSVVTFIKIRNET